MRIYDWTKLIKRYVTDSKADQAELIESFRDEFQEIRDSLFDGDKVIIRFGEGFRAEAYYTYQIGHFDIRKVSRDFRRIYEYNQSFQQMQETVVKIRDLLKDHQDILDTFNSYIQQTTELPLFEINFIRDNKVKKSVSGIPYDFVEAYIEGVLESNGIYVKVVQSKV